MGDKIMEFIENNSVNDLISYLDYILREAERLHSSVRLKLWGVMLFNTPAFVYSLYRIITLQDNKLDLTVLGHLGVLLLTVAIFFYAIILRSKKTNLYSIIETTVRYKARIMKVNNSHMDEFGKKSRLYNLVKMYLGSLSATINMSRKELLRHLQQRDLDKYLSRI